MCIIPAFFFFFCYGFYHSPSWWSDIVEWPHAVPISLPFRSFLFSPLLQKRGYVSLSLRPAVTQTGTSSFVLGDPPAIHLSVWGKSPLFSWTEIEASWRWICFLSFFNTPGLYGLYSSPLCMSHISTWAWGWMSRAWTTPSLSLFSHASCILYGACWGSFVYRIAVGARPGFAPM